MSDRVLVTAFEPFMSGWSDVVGAVRKHILKRNASLDVLRLLQERDDVGVCEFEVLGVSEQGERQFEGALDRLDPVAVLSMGEHAGLGPGHVNLEPFAVEAPVSRGEDACQFPAIESSFAARQARTLGVELVSEIGTYYCNRIYRAGLCWSAQRSDRPVAFIHVPVRGRRSLHAEQVAAVLSGLQGAAA